LESLIGLLVALVDSAHNEEFCSECDDWGYYSLKYRADAEQLYNRFVSLKNEHEEVLSHSRIELYMNR